MIRRARSTVLSGGSNSPSRVPLGRFGFVSSWGRENLCPELIAVLSENRWAQALRFHTPYIDKSWRKPSIRYR